MPSTSKHNLTIHCDGKHWQAIDDNQNMMTLSIADDALLPLLPEGAIVGKLLLPIEQLLNRTFSLPFANPKFIDQDILAQELEERSSENSDGWWLSWRAGQSSNGVSGMMIGLPETLRQHIEANDAWSGASIIAPDIWARLHHQLDTYLQTQQTEALNESDNTAPGTIAVFDTDNSGLFFGVWQCTNAINKQGYWLAMRRLNWPEGSAAFEPEDGLVENIQRSLQSMGWQHEAITIGSLSLHLHAALNFSAWHGELLEADALPSRRDATIAAAASPDLNFRHGKWRSGSHMSQIKPWYRSLVLATTLMLVWSGSMMWQNHQLEQQVSMHQQRLISAFHQGLPNEKVMIDALAQLQKAAGYDSNNESKHSRNLASQWLQHMEVINRVYQRITWTVKEVTFKDGSMTISGQVNDLQTMNKLQQTLQSETGKEVKIQDTDLTGSQVKFRLVWS